MIHEEVTKNCHKWEDLHVPVYQVPVVKIRFLNNVCIDRDNTAYPGDVNRTISDSKIDWTQSLTS